MPWTVINRTQPAYDPGAPPVLSEAVREKIRSFFPRYETKRAVLLPALHVVQSALGCVSWRAIAEVAELLELHPSQVIDAISFYTHFWIHPRGKKVITVCRSISCEVMGGAEVLEEIKAQLGVEEHRTTSDGRYSLAVEECLGGCDHAPCLLINENLHRKVKREDVASILANPENDVLSIPRSDLFDAPQDASPTIEDDGRMGTTSDVQEMRDAGPRGCPTFSEGGG